MLPVSAVRIAVRIAARIAARIARAASNLIGLKN